MFAKNTSSVATSKPLSMHGWYGTLNPPVKDALQVPKKTSDETKERQMLTFRGQSL